MQGFTPPKDNERYRWTAHVVRKMVHYRLTPSRVIRIVRAPERVETGVAPGTMAGMQRTGSKEKPTELWAMWRTERKAPGASEKAKGKSSKVVPSNASLLTEDAHLRPDRKVIITAWRYPGISPVREAVPIPSDVLAELDAEGLLDEPF